MAHAGGEVKSWPQGGSTRWKATSLARGKATTDGAQVARLHEEGTAAAQGCHAREAALSKQLGKL